MITAIKNSALIALSSGSVLPELLVGEVVPHGVSQRRLEEEHLILVPFVLQRQPKMIIMFFSPLPPGIIHAGWVAMKNAHLIIDNMFQSQKSRRLTKTSNGSFMM